MSLDQAGMPPELATLIEQRLGQDRLDEVWDGVYVMAPDPTGDTWSYAPTACRKS
ncbi:MAG: hypothetical protein ACXV5Q_10770 [Frankiaceae bacterium]